MDTRKHPIQGRAVELFKLCEAHLIGLRMLLDVVHAAMERLVEQFRKEFHGFRLVLYLKTWPDHELSRALYWAAFNGPPQELFTASGKKLVRWKKHIAGGLKRSTIYKKCEASRKEGLLEMDRKALALNEAHEVLSDALQSAEKRWMDRGVRRPWESQDLDLEAPALSHDLDKRYHPAMGGAWRFFTRTTAASSRLQALCAAYRAAPIHPDLGLTFVSDKAHPHGRARWIWKGYPLARLESSGIQDRLTDSLMRRMRIKQELRRLLTEVELQRRQCARDLKYYSGPLGDFLKRSKEALLIAHTKLAAAEGRSVDVA